MAGLRGSARNSQARPWCPAQGFPGDSWAVETSCPPGLRVTREPWPRQGPGSELRPPHGDGAQHSTGLGVGRALARLSAGGP